MGSKGNHRAPWLDYRSPQKYFITLLKAPGIPTFGEIRTAENGSIQTVFLSPSKIGAEIKFALINISKICPELRLWQYTIMPDHIHLLVNIPQPLSEPLGLYIARFKTFVNTRCNAIIFSEGFNDQIITARRPLDPIFNYIRQNPHRLAIRLAHPDYFRRINRITIAGAECSAYGNLSLLDNPFKMQVICHRADSEETRAHNREQWLYSAANGGVLVSPFISPVEKEIRKAAEQLGGRIILINNHPLEAKEKPAAHDFELCHQGLLLIISPFHLPQELDRQTCLAMNALAARLAHSSS